MDCSQASLRKGSLVPISWAAGSLQQVRSACPLEGLLSYWQTVSDQSPLPSVLGTVSACVGVWMGVSWETWHRVLMSSGMSRMVLHARSQSLLTVELALASLWPVCSLSASQTVLLSAPCLSASFSPLSTLPVHPGPPMVQSRLSCKLEIRTPRSLRLFQTSSVSCCCCFSSGPLLFAALGSISLHM